MPQLNTIKFLNENSLEQLTSTYFIKVNKWDKGDLWVLNYDQIDSPKNHPITNECRSLVVSYSCICGWYVVSRSFDRFFNYGEIQDDFHDITKMTAYEKVDGSIVSLFYFQGEWLYRTRSMIMPESCVNGWDTTWKDLIEPVLFGKGFYEYCHDVNCTYIFEVVGAANRVVTRYNESAAYLLAVRSNETGYYFSTHFWHPELRGWKVPKHYNFETFSDCVLAAKELRDLNEGFVLYDNFGTPKVKVKNPAYVAAHLLRGEGLNPKRIMQLIIMNETAEYLSIFPEDEEHFDKYIRANACLEDSIITSFNKYNHIESQKDFALEVKDLCYSGVLFSARKQNKNPIDVLHNMGESYRIKLLTQYMEIF
jgi:hypothetical protein